MPGFDGAVVQPVKDPWMFALQVCECAAEVVSELNSVQYLTNEGWLPPVGVRLPLDFLADRRTCFCRGSCFEPLSLGGLPRLGFAFLGF